MAIGKVAGTMALAAGLLAAAGVSAQAELPPQYTVWQNFLAITALSDIPDKLGVVERIERLADGSYRVHAGKCAIEAKVVRQSARGPDGSPMAGPSRIVRVDVGEKRCD